METISIYDATAAKRKVKKEQKAWKYIQELCGRNTDCVLAGRGAEQAAVSLGLPLRDMRTEASMQKWREAVVRFAKRVFASGDTLSADFLFANYDAPLKGTSLEWRLDIAGATGVSPVADEIPLGPARKVTTAKIAFPDVAKPAKATLTATLGGVSNSWDFWVFPRRALRDGSAIAVAPRFRAALEKRYANLLAPEAAARAKVVVAEYGTPLAAEALARGQRVVTLAGTEGKPNVLLGWWWMGRQVGTALAQHPALAALPHEGVLSPLLFRLVLQTGKPMPYAGLAQDDMLMVGEGGEMCYLYLAHANVGSGKALMAFGLNLLADTPEAAALLDGLVDYAASDRFAPKSRVEMATRPPW